MAAAKSKKLTRYLIIRNGDDCRVVTKKPVLDANEVAIEINLTVPQPPRIVASIDIELPEPAPVEASANPTPFTNPLL